MPCQQTRHISRFGLDKHEVLVTDLIKTAIKQMYALLIKNVYDKKTNTVRQSVFIKCSRYFKPLSVQHPLKLTIMKVR